MTNVHSRSLAALAIAACAVLHACASDAPGPQASWNDHGDAAAITNDARVATDVAPDANVHGAACDDAIALAAGVTLTAQRTPREGSPDTTCRPSDAPRRFYSFTVPSGQRAVVTVTPTGEPAWRAVVRMRRACDEDACVADGESAAPGAPVAVSYGNDNTEAVFKVVEVSGTAAEAGGAFDIALRFEPLDGEAACALPVVRALTLPRDTASGTLSTPALAGPPSCYSSFAEAIYSLDVAERTDVALLAPCGRYEFDCALSVRRACDDVASEVACQGPSYHLSTRGGYLRTSLDRGRYYVLVSGGRDEPYTLDLWSYEGAPNSACATATPVHDGDVIRGDFALGGHHDSCGIYQDQQPIGASLFYSMRIPPGDTMFVEFAGAPPTHGGRFAIATTCAPRACLSPGCSGSFCGGNLPEWYTNRGAAPLDVIFSVSAGSMIVDPTRSAPFELSVRLAPRASNSTCATATPVHDGDVLRRENTVLGGETRDVCGITSDHTLYYSATVAPGETLFASARPSPEGTATSCTRTLRALRSCGEATCVAPVASSDLSYTNESAATQTLPIALSCGSTTGTPGGPFDLSFFVRRPPSHAACDRATAVHDGTHLALEGPVRAFEAGATCLASAPGRTLYYAATVPPGQTLAVLARRALGPHTAPVVRLAESCGAASCLAEATRDASREQAALRFDNTGPSARRVVFSVAGAPGADALLVDVDVAIVPTRGSGAVTAMALGQYATCTLRRDRAVWCSGQLGDGPQWLAPTEVDGAHAVTQLSLGTAHACARRADGSVWCWGANNFGQLGDGTTTTRLTPAAVSALRGAVEVAAGVAHTCARLADGTVRCWGSNASGQFGNGSAEGSPTPVAVPGLGDVTQIVAGGYYSCALRVDRTVWCWGANNAGQLGDGTIASMVRTGPPVAVAGLTDVTQISAGYEHACARRADGTAWCWGYDAGGQLGDGATMDRGVAARVPSLTGVAQVAAGFRHTCARGASGAVSCWGANFYGQLGDGSTDDRHVPTAVPGMSDAVEVSLGVGHTCARRADDTVWCWGSDLSGELGDATLTQRTSPVATLF